MTPLFINRKRIPPSLPSDSNKKGKRLSSSQLRGVHQIFFGPKWRKIPFVTFFSLGQRRMTSAVLLSLPNRMRVSISSSIVHKRRATHDMHMGCRSPGKNPRLSSRPFLMRIKIRTFIDVDLDPTIQQVQL
jgi:hypothetical protein